MNNTKKLLSIHELKKYFPIKKSSIFQREQLYVRANDGISIDIYEGETFGLVGESGCGKSTLGRVLLQLYPQTSGTSMYYGRSLDSVNPRYVFHTLRNARAYINRLRHAEAKLAGLEAQCDAAGDDASFPLLEKRRNARAARDKAQADIAKIMGGFMVLEDLSTPADMLLKQFQYGHEIFKLEQKNLTLHNTVDLLSGKDGSESKIEKLKRKIHGNDESIKSFTAKQQAQKDAIAALTAKHSSHPEFAKYEAMRDDGIDLSRLRYDEIRLLRRDMQLIFQDPYSSLNPRMTVGQIIEEGLVTHKFFKRGSQKMQDYILEEMGKCGLAPYFLHRYPHQFSGGQRQRICITRALAIKPKFVVCDEAVSALDVSIQSQIINLLQELKERENLTYLFISHDLSVVKFISDRIGVMYLGDLVEMSDTARIFDDPRHPYTVALLSSIPTTEQDNKRERIILEGNIPSPIKPPSGCKFRTRCYMATEKCSRIPPELTEIEPGHFVACHYPDAKLDDQGRLLKRPAPAAE